MQQQDSGILLGTTGTGILMTNTQLRIVPSMGSIRVTSDRATTVYLLWAYADDPEHLNYTIPIDVPSGTLVDIPFSLSDVAGWSGGEKNIGIVLVPDTTILLHAIKFDALNPFETFAEMMKSFWTFDAIRTYSINFLWGPSIAFSPAERAKLFLTVPPTSLSGTFVIFTALFLILGILFLARRKIVRETTKRTLLIASLITMLCAWLLLDLRMGLEFLDGVRMDHQQYIGVPESDRTFRDRNRFYDFAAFAESLVADRSSYIFFAEQQWPYLGNMRYLTYPAIPGIDIDHDDTWVIYRRSDVSVSPTGELTIDGQPVTAPGRILGRFDEHSFVFRAPTATPSAS